MATTRLGVGGPAAAYPGFTAKDEEAVAAIPCYTATFTATARPTARLYRVPVPRLGSIEAASAPTATVEGCD